MRIQKFTHFVVAALLLVAACAVNASAQMTTATGTVTLKQADGTEVPIKDAVVEIHRTDIKQSLKTKTNKKGEYVYAGIDITGTYTIIVSAPGATPSYISNVRLSQRPANNFSLSPGDGRSLTLAEVKAAATAAPSTGKPGTAAATTAAAPASGGMSPEEAKKKQEELAKEIAAVTAKNAKIEERNAKLPVIFKAGNDAVNASNSLKGADKISKLDEAINNYNQGIEIDPEAAVVYGNKQIALRSRGLEKYNLAIVNKDKDARNAGLEAARNDLKEAVDTSEKAIVAYQKEKAEGQAADTGGAASGQKDPGLTYLEDRAETYRRALQIKAPIDNAAAAKSIEEYINSETDPSKKEKMQTSLGDALFYAGRVDDSIAKFREILGRNPNNIDAIYGLGLALASSNPPQLAEARDMLQQYASKAPDTASRKQEALEMVKYLDATIQGEAANKAQDSKSDKGRAGKRKP
jgi:tetratricopeptide (TPR) repeat protein